MSGPSENQPGNQHQPEMRPERDAAIRAMLIERVRDEPSVRARRRRRFALGWAGLGALALGAAATAGAVLLQPVELTDFTVVYCMSSSERNADGSYPGSGASMADDDRQGAASIDDPIGFCRMVWEEGLFEPGYDPLAVTNPPGRAPEEMQLCVGPDDMLSVVPSSNPSICQAIGLAPLAGE
jgi:hypothetical protein